MNILLGITGSVAATLSAKMITELQKFGEVQIIVTDRAIDMLGLTSPCYVDHKPLVPGVKMWADSDEWPGWPNHKWEKGDPIKHTDLKNWADILVIAPLSANTLAKMANGLSDNLLTSVVRAWPIWKPMFVAPAMNIDMWDKRVTQRHLQILTQDYERFYCVDPQSKTLACGDYGQGAMADIDSIIYEVKNGLRWTPPLPDQGSGVYIPKGKHPGAFGAVRKHDVHTGVDLYARAGEHVRAVEPGVIISIFDFTGANTFDQDGKPMSWWDDTKAVLVKGASGVIVYGEITPDKYLVVGQVISRHALIGCVKAVLPASKIRKDIPHHSNIMLHMELYTNEAAEKNFRWKSWEIRRPRPDGLLDPTPFLTNMD